MQDNPLLITARVTRVLEKLGVRYFITGSFASTLYGMLRTTQDSDLVTELTQEHIHLFMADLEDEFYMDEEMISEAVSRRSSFNIIHKEFYFKVDVFTPHQRRFLEKQFERARLQTLSVEPLIKAWVASPEDTLLAKLEWFRKGGEVSELQWRDVLGVLKVQAGLLDMTYLDHMSKEIGVDDLLLKALRDS